MIKYFLFEPTRSLQTICYLIKDCIDYNSLMKFLYYIDFKSLIEFNFSVTGSNFVIKDDKIISQEISNKFFDDSWSEYLDIKSNIIKKIKNPGNGELSRYICKLINEVKEKEINLPYLTSLDEIFEYGKLSKTEVVERKKQLLEDLRINQIFNNINI